MTSSLSASATGASTVPVAGTALEIPILGQRRAATAIADAPYDPGNLRPRM